MQLENSQTPASSKELFLAMREEAISSSPASLLHLLGSFLRTYLWNGPENLPQSLRMEWRFVAIRWLGILIIAPSLWLFGLSQTQLTGAYLTLALAAGYNLILQINLKKNSSFVVSGYFPTIFDALLNIAMVIVAGGFDSTFYLVLFSTIVSGAMRYGYGPVLMMAGLFVGADLVEGIFSGAPVSAAFFLRSSWLLLTAVIAAYLHEQARDAEAALEEKLHQARSLNRELEAFSYSVSHDLRAPLRSIDGFSQALLEDYGETLDDDGQDYLRRVRAASQRMAQLIDDLLNLSRLTRSEMHREAVNLSTIASEIVQDLKQLEPDRNIRVKIEPDIIANGDERLLRAVFENLINNAWKFTQNSPNACLEFGKTFIKGRPTYYVKDNGVGFDMAYANKLFGAFQRLHSIDEFDGNGIGLATVQRIIHRHGGQVWGEGEVGLGATFYFTL